MPELTESVIELIDKLARLPGIGRKSAERIAYHILRVHKDEALALADSIRNVRENVRYCEICFNLAETEKCPICANARREQKTLCIVQQPRDLISIEQSGHYNGLYHVLLGRIAPLENIGPDQLTIDPLVNRVASGNFEEVIMATNPTVEGDGTALYISNLLSEYNVKITSLLAGLRRAVFSNTQIAKLWRMPFPADNHFDTVVELS